MRLQANFVEYFGANNFSRLFVRNEIIYFALDHRQSHGANKVGPRTEQFVCVCMHVNLVEYIGSHARNLVSIWYCTQDNLLNRNFL